jgi:Leucine-rich repeat (LRR) protein
MIKLLLRPGAQLDQPPGTLRPLSDFALRQVYEAGEAAWGAKAAEKAKWLTKRNEGLLVIDYLLTQGLDINSRTVGGMTALHRAAREFDPFVLEYLLEKGADPNLKLGKGVTPLMIALEKSNLAAAELLLKYGADPLLANQDGETAADRAYQLKEVAMLRLLNPGKQYAAFVKEFTPVANSPLIATWSNKKSGFSTVLLHFEANGHGGMVSAIGIEFRFIWKADRHGEVTMIFPPQRHLDVVITGTGPQQEQTMQGRFNPEREMLILHFNGKQMSKKVSFRKVGESWEQLRTGGAGKKHEPTPDERLVSALKQLQRNHSFYLSGAGLLNWPDQLFRDTQLKSLMLEKNHLTAIPDQIGKLIKLKSLNLMGNQIENLPIELGKLSLHDLNLSDNRLSVIPKGLRFNEKLETLDLSDNRLQQIGPSLVGCQNLRSLQLRENELVRINGDLKNLRRLRSLNLSFNRLQNIPTALTTLPALEWLTITNNRILILPATFGKLASIKRLMLASNRLQSLPESIGQLSNLSTLDVSNNRLTSLPTAIGHLASLETLKLARNQITILPSEINSLKQLISLDVSSNRISSLPENLAGLESLKIVDLSFNNFESMPFQLGQLPNLRRLDIRGNKIPKEQIEEFSTRHPNVRFM